jgi:L-fuconolactonase
MIDAHQHFWQFDPVRDAWIDPTTMSAIRRDFMPTDLEPILHKNGFGGCVAVQADQSDVETLFLAELAIAHPFIRGVVGWVDLQSPRLSERLEQLTHFNVIKGFRHILQGEKPEFMLQPAFMSGVRELGKRGYTYDILVFPKHLTAVRTFLRQLDDQPFIIDHIAKPYIRKGLIRQWQKDIQAIARYPNVYCKLSGMTTEADWTRIPQTDFRPYMEVVFEAFDADRIVYGSDWPVCLLASSYEAQLHVIQTYTNTLSTDEQRKIFGTNAAKFYKV